MLCGTNLYWALKLISKLTFGDGLLIGGRVLTEYVDYTNRLTCVILDDGAGAALGNWERKRTFQNHCAVNSINFGYSAGTYKSPDSQCDLNYIPNEPRPFQINDTFNFRFSEMCFAGNLEDLLTQQTLEKRRTYMREAVPFGSGAMAAILSLIDNYRKLIIFELQTRNKTKCLFALSPRFNDTYALYKCGNDSDCARRVSAIWKYQSGRFGFADGVRRYNPLTVQVSTPLCWAQTFENLIDNDVEKFVEVGA